VALAARGPVRALAGAGLAVAGVLLGVAALLWLAGDTQAGSPVVSPGVVIAGQAPAAAPAPLTRQDPARLAPTRTPTTAAAPSRATPTQGSTAQGSAATPPLTVLNNSRRRGLAVSAAGRFRAGGWPVAVTGGFTGRLRTTTVYYGPGQRVAAERLAARFGLPRVLPRFAGLPGAGLTVVLTSDYA
jgi:hypothetical protein